MSAGWQFWIDRGGTFTDIVARGPDGTQIVRKLLSVKRERYADAAREGIRQILAEHGAQMKDVATVKLGTTVATNALLERKGADVVLVTTEGFADALDIGNQARPSIFARQIVKPELLYRRVIEARERIAADGEVLIPLDEEGVRAALESAYEDGFRAAAIACLNAYAHPLHERRLAAIAREIGFTQISSSSEISGLIKFIPRADTAVADAYLSPVLRAYVEGFAAALGAPASNAHKLEARTGGPNLLCMQSNGGLTHAGAFRGRDAVLSGPAGGVVAMAAAARRAGFAKALGFDMGGTSTDVSHFAGEFARTNESIVAGVRLVAPMLEVHTVAAGGGSICSFDGMRLRVGPHSAGADPGPASYRRGGPLTVTDCNVLLGRVQAEFFPAIFGPNGDQKLDRGIVEEKFAALCAEIERATGRVMTPPQAAEGFLAIANLNMAEAIKKISIQRGYNPAEYVLVSFGGAGGQHACAVADAADVNTILIHPLAGVLSAWGIGLADVRAIAEETVERNLSACADLADRYEALGARAAALLEHPERAQIEITAHLKYEGADFTLPVAGRAPDLAAAFVSEHKQRFGFTDPARAIVLASLTAEAVAHEGGAHSRQRTPAPRPPPLPPAHATSGLTVAVHDAGRTHQAPVFARTELGVDFVCDGPALIIENGATTCIDAGWRARMSEHGELILTRSEPRSARQAIGVEADPILLEVFNNRFMSVAEEMGLALQTSASSVNIK